MDERTRDRQEIRSARARWSDVRHQLGIDKGEGREVLDSLLASNTL